MSHSRQSMQYFLFLKFYSFCINGIFVKCYIIYTCLPPAYILFVVVVSSLHLMVMMKRIYLYPSQRTASLTHDQCQRRPCAFVKGSVKCTQLYISYLLPLNHTSFTGSLLLMHLPANRDVLGLNCTRTSSIVMAIKLIFIHAYCNDCRYFLHMFFLKILTIFTHFL